MHWGPTRANFGGDAEANLVAAHAALQQTSVNH